MSTCSFCGQRMSAQADFCPVCGEESPDQAKRRRDRFRPTPPTPSFSERVTLQGGTALRLLLVLVATLFGSTVFVGLFFEDNLTGLFWISVAMAVATLACAYPERAEIRTLFQPEALATPRPWLLALGITPFLPLLAQAWVHLLGLDQGLAYDPFAELGVFGKLLLICVFPAIFEELAFRGVVLGALHHMLRPRGAHLLTAALFAGMHFEPLIFPYHLLIGLYLGWLREKGGNLPVPMLAHGLHNAAVLFLYHSA